MKKEKLNLAEEIYNEVKERAAEMFLDGNPPDTSWWLERLEESLAKVLNPKS